MKISISKLLLALLVIPVCAQAQNYLNNDMVRVAMSAYAAQIEENPQDYMAYYNRAKDYFKYGEKDLALADLTEAIKYFPRKEASDLSQAYTMRALIYQERADFANALNDLNEALKLDPSSRYSLIARADLLYDNGDYDLAKRDYEMLVRRDARCQEAYLGLGRIAYHQNNMGLCDNYLERARNANPTNPEFYIQRGAFYESIGNTQSAANDYVNALVYDERSSKALGAVNRLTLKAYPQVVTALDDALTRVQDKGFFYFLRALIHKNSWHYTASINDWNTILAEKYFYTHSIFYNRAYCYFHLGQFEYALNDVNMALSLRGENINYYVLRARLARLAGEYEQAAADLKVASTYDPANIEVLQQTAILAMEMGDNDKAMQALNEAIMNNADDAFSYLLRATLAQRMGDTDKATSNYEMIVAVPEAVPSVYSLRGFALARLGRTAEADAWMQAALAAAVTAEEYYYAACYYAMTGNKQHALKNLEEALKKGYGDYYNIYFENDSPISLEPLRADADFRSLVQQYSSVF